MRAAGQHLQQHREEDDRRSIVEQAFPFQQSGKPWRGAEIAKNRDNGRRVGGRDNRAKQHRKDQRHSEE